MYLVIMLRVIRAQFYFVQGSFGSVLNFFTHDYLVYSVQVINIEEFDFDPPAAVLTDYDLDF